MSETESCMKCLICLFGDEVRLYLTRFNKIAIQGTPQMAVD